MGSCVSVRKDPGTPMKLRVVIGSKNHKLVNPSPVKQKENGVDHPPKSQPSPPHTANPSLDFGSKDETFFDTQVYLESDCDDDFHSVRGDFTPSQGSTPIHQSFSAVPPKVNVSPFTQRDPISVPQVSPTEKKKRLSELFKESLGGDQEFNAFNPVKDNPNAVSVIKDPEQTDSKLLIKSTVGTPYSSACSDTTPSQELKRVPKSGKVGQCCLPKLRSRRSFNEREKIGSPVRVAG